MVDSSFNLKKEDIFVDRNLLGVQLEKTDPEKAIELYELNVKEGFDGSHPYERLRILYGYIKDYENVIRVCEAFIAMSETKAYPDTKLVDKHKAAIQKIKLKKHR